MKLFTIVRLNNIIDTSLFYKVVNNPNESEDFDYYKMLKEGEYFNLYAQHGEVQKIFFYLSLNEKNLCWRETGMCSCSVNYLPVNGLKFISMGRRGNFSKHNIDASYEQNCISILIEKQYLDLKLDDDKKCKKWFKAIQSLILRVESNKKIIEENKKKKMRNNIKIIDDEFLDCIWKSEIIHCWEKYRGLITDDNCISNNSMEINFDELASKLEKENIKIDHWKKSNIENIWNLGIPQKIRKTLWSMIIGNKLDIDGYFYNSLEVGEFVNFAGLVKDIDCITSIKMTKNFSMTNILGSHLETNKTATLNNADESENEDSKNKYRNKYKFNNNLEDFISSFTSNQISNLIIIDSLTLYERFKDVIIKENLCSKEKFLEDVFYNLKKFSLFRPDISYSYSLANIFTVLYLNNTNNLSSFSNFINFIFNPKFEFLLKFLDKDENFVNQRIIFFEFWLKALCPDVKLHFDKMEISTKLYFFNWLENLYTESFEYSHILKLWDMLFLKGECVLYEVALAIISLQEKELLNCLINETIERLNKPEVKVVNRIFEIITNNEIDLMKKFQDLQYENNLGQEKAILLESYFDDDF